MKDENYIHIIEVTCTGNIGRSPMAEIIGNNTVKSFNLEDKLSFISSGTRAASEHDNILPYDKVVSYLNRASSHGLMKSVDVDREKYEQDSNYRITIQDKVHMASRIMRPIEAALRDSALYHIGLKYDGKRTQTIPRHDVSLILGMEQKHVEQIKEIYFVSEHIPLITTIIDYAGDEGEILESIGNTNPAVYFKIRDRLCELMPKIVNRFREEWKL